MGQTAIKQFIIKLSISEPTVMMHEYLGTMHPVRKCLNRK